MKPQNPPKKTTFFKNRNIKFEWSNLHFFHSDGFSEQSGTFKNVVFFVLFKLEQILRG
jgi:hypothetical protein